MGCVATGGARVEMGPLILCSTSYRYLRKTATLLPGPKGRTPI